MPLITVNEHLQNLHNIAEREVSLQLLNFLFLTLLAHRARSRLFYSNALYKLLTYLLTYLLTCYCLQTAIETV